MQRLTKQENQALNDLPVRARRLKGAISESLSGFGGYLRCEECGTHAPLGDPGARVTGEGWPKHCGYTMRWWTQRQIDAGEVPPIASR